MKDKNVSRRDFLRDATCAAIGTIGLAYIIPSSALGKAGYVAASNRTTVGWGTLSWLASRHIGNAEGLTLGRVTIKAGKSNPRHRHPKSEEVLYLLKGRLNHTLGDKTITMSAGDVITIPPGIFHNAACIGAEDAEMIVVYSQGTRRFELEKSP